MRVLHVYSGNLFGGIETILVSIARGQGRIPEVAHEFALSFEGRLSEDLEAAGARVHRLPSVRASRPHSVRAARRALARIVGVGNVNCVVCHAPWALGMFGGVAARERIPLVFWAHDVMSGRHWTERLARRVVPDLAIANSNYTAQSLPHLYPTVPAVVIYAPVFLSEGSATGIERLETRRSVYTSETAVVIVTASRAEAWKGHLLLVDALAELGHLPDWIWWQVGGAQRPAESRFLQEVRDAAVARGIADRVRWMGERRDVPRLLAAADIHCQPNCAPEPFGVAFVEALAARLPVVTADLGGAGEIVDTRCGLLVPPNDKTALASALSRLITDWNYRLALARGGPERARRLCDPSSQLRMLATTLEEMVMSPAAASRR